MLILGFNSTHDASAALVGDGRILCAVEEERFSRKKHHYGFPELSIEACLRTAGVTWRDIDCVTFYWNPYRGLLPFGLHFLSHLPASARYLGHQPGIWGNFLGLPRELARRYGYRGPFRYHSHHLNHLASACFPSPFDEAAALTVDGTGEWETTVLSHFRNGKIERLGRIDYPHSLGKLWEVTTQYLGFKPNSGEGKVMGLAPYGKPRYLETFRKIVLPRGRAGYRLDESWFLFHLGSKIKYGPRWIDAFGPPREPESEIESHHEDLARTLQEVTEVVVTRIVRNLLRRTGLRKLCLAGGVALNSVMNGKLLDSAGVEDIYIQPSAGDAGAALGSALVQEHLIEGGKVREEMRHGHWGTSATPSDLKRAAEASGYPCRKPDRIEDECARLVADGRILGWFQGRMEYGPRALGARSIIADARRPEMKDTLNHKVKHREGFRPFAPACLAEHAAEWFVGGRHSPFMLLVFPVAPEKRALVPSITHVDGTGRLQTVDEHSEPRYRGLIEAFFERTGVPIVLNTSFNIRGEPIVETPDQAVECFRKTGLDVLALGDRLLEKNPGGTSGESSGPLKTARTHERSGPGEIMLRQHQISFLELLLETQALRFGDFTLKSGRHSPYFINTGCFHTGATTDRLADCYVRRLEELSADGLEFDVVFGPAYKGIPLAVAVSSAWNRRTGRDVGWCFNRKEAKDHGDKGRLVGASIEGKRVILVDDVLTAGTSMREALALISDVPDARPVGALISVDREERGRGMLAATKELEKEHGLPVHAIVGIGDAVEYLHENEVGGVRHVSDDAFALFRDYRALYGAASAP